MVPEQRTVAAKLTPTAEIDGVTVSPGQRWRRRKDGRLVEVVWLARTWPEHGGAMRVQLRKAGATNLKSTHWVDLWNLPLLYQLEPEEKDCDHPLDWWDAFESTCQMCGVELGYSSTPVRSDDPIPNGTRWRACLLRIDAYLDNELRPDVTTIRDWIEEALR